MLPEVCSILCKYLAYERLLPAPTNKLRILKSKVSTASGYRMKPGHHAKAGSAGYKRTSKSGPTHEKCCFCGYTHRMA